MSQFDVRRKRCDFNRASLTRYDSTTVGSKYQRLVRILFDAYQIQLKQTTTQDQTTPKPPETKGAIQIRRTVMILAHLSMIAGLVAPLLHELLHLLLQGCQKNTTFTSEESWTHS